MACIDARHGLFGGAESLWRSTCGEIEAETARGLFAAFAEKHDLLAPETDIITASRRRHDKDPYVR